VYNPGKASIKVAAIQTLLTQAQGSLRAADVSRTAYENAINARQPVFDTIPKLGSRVIAALKANGASPEVVADAMAIKRRFSSSGKQRQPISSGQVVAATDQEEQFRRKISQLDLASRIENFARLVDRVSAEPSYKPNEAELKVSGLQAFVATLRDKNKTVITAFMALKNANTALNSILFQGNGIHENANAVKNYIVSVHGRGSEKHKALIAIKFRNR
jgi:hypothetical protein